MFPFANLPTDFVKSHIYGSEWFTPTDLGRMDSAMSSQELRGVLMDMFPRMDTKLLELPQSTNLLQYREWSEMRGVLMVLKLDFNETNVSCFDVKRKPSFKEQRVGPSMKSYSVKNKKLFADNLTKFISITPKLVCLSYSANSGLTDEFVNCVAAYCPSLQSVNFSVTHMKANLTVTDHSIVALAKSCPDLRTVRLSYMILLTTASVEAVSQCPRLTELELWHLPLLSDATVLENILRNCCTTLTRFELSLPYMMADGLNSLCSSLSKLETLNFDFSPYRVNPDMYVQQNMFNPTAVSGLGNLITLTIYCVELNDVTLTALLTHCTKLQSLLLSDQSMFTEAGYAQIPLKCPNLICLALIACSSLTDAVVAAVTFQCVHIRCLDFTECKRLNEASIAAFSTNCPTLRVLSVPRWKELRITSALLQSLFNGCPMLRGLDIAYNTICEDAVTTVIGPGTSLSVFKIFYCRNQTDTNPTAYLLANVPEVALLTGAHSKLSFDS